MASVALRGERLRFFRAEQFESPRDIDARSDIWSLGVILFELLTGGVCPFDGDKFSRLMAQVLTAEPARLSSIRGDLPDGLEAIVMRCLAKASDDRWPDVAALVEALAPYGTESARASLVNVRAIVASSADGTRQFMPSNPELFAGGMDTTSAVWTGSSRVLGMRSPLWIPVVATVAGVGFLMSLGSVMRRDRPLTREAAAATVAPSGVANAASPIVAASASASASASAPAFAPEPPLEMLSPRSPRRSAETSTRGKPAGAVVPPRARPSGPSTVAPADASVSSSAHHDPFGGNR